MPEMGDLLRAGSVTDPFFEVLNDGDWNACIGKQGDEINYVEGYHVAKGFDYLSGPAAQRSSGKFVPQPKRRLPLAHPLENVQQIFRPQFHVLQIPEIIPSAEVQQQTDREFAILQQAG